MDTLCLCSPSKPCQLGRADSSCWSSVLVLKEFPSWFSMQSEASVMVTMPVFFLLIYPKMLTDMLQHLLRHTHARESCSCASDKTDILEALCTKGLKSEKAIPLWSPLTKGYHHQLLCWPEDFKCCLTFFFFLNQKKMKLSKKKFI